MARDYEAIHAALFARLSASLTGIVNKTRRIVTYDDLPQLQQPALEVVGMAGHATRQLGVPSIETMRAMVTIYVREPNNKALTVETTLFDYVKQVDAALARQANELGPEDDPGTSLYAELAALNAPAIFRCFRVDYEIHHGAGADQAAVSMTIEMVTLE